MPTPNAQHRLRNGQSWHRHPGAAGTRRPRPRGAPPGPAGSAGATALHRTPQTGPEGAHRFTPSPEREGDPIVLHPARLLPWKGVRLSLEMLRQHRRAGMDARLILTDTQAIVDWDDQLTTYRAEILSFIDEAKLGDAVEMRAVTYGEIPRLYREADVVVYPTIGDEPYGLVPLEAMSSGRAIVASRSGGMTETIVDGITGFIVRRGEVSELAQRVGLLLMDPARRRCMGMAARRHVVANYALSSYVGRLLRRYQLLSPASF